MGERQPKTINPQQALKRAESATRKVLDFLSEQEIIKVGEPNATGEIMTQTAIDQLSKKITQAGLKVLSSRTP